MGPKSGQKHTVRRRRNAAARRNSYWLSLCCCALALKPAVAAEIASAQQTPSQEASPGPHGVDRLEQTSSQCDAELALAQHALTEPPSRVLLKTGGDELATQSFSGLHTGQTRRSLSQALGAYSPVPPSSAPALTGNLSPTVSGIPAPSGYIQTALPYSPPVVPVSPSLMPPPPLQSPPPFLSSPPPPIAESSPASPTPAATTATIFAPVLVSSPSGTAAATALPSASISPLPATSPVPIAASPAATSAPATTPVGTASQTAVAFSVPTAVPSPSDVETTPTLSPSPAGSSSPGAAAYGSPAAVTAPTSPTAVTAGSATPSSPVASPSQPGASAADVSASPLSLPAVPAAPAAPTLVFPNIPPGFEPLVTCQATFEQIPSDSLTAAEVAEVAASLTQALATYVGNATTITTAVVATNAVPLVAASPSVSRRQLLQTSGNTQQATVLFTLAFISAPTQSDAAVIAAVQSAVASAVSLTVTTTVAAVGGGAYSVTVLFPPNNQVSTSTSQGTSVATQFLTALKGDPAASLPAVSASFGSFNLTSSQLTDALVTASPSSDATPAASITAVIAANSSLATPVTPAAIAEATPAATPAATLAAAAAATVAGTPVTPAVTPPATPATPASPTATEASSTSTSPAETPAATAAPQAPAETSPATSTSASSTGSPTLTPSSPPLPPPSTSPSFTGTATAPASPTLMESPTTAAAAPAPEEAAPYSSPASSPLVYNVSVAFLPSAISAAQDLASTLFNQSDKALYAIVAANGAVNITDLVYGYVPNVAALAPAPGPFTSLSVAPAAAAAPEASAGAAIESYTDPNADEGSASSTSSGQLYAINMQYGVTGAISNTSTNLLMLALPAQPEVLPTGSDFTVQLERSNQTCSVAVLPDQTSGADVLVQVICPEAQTGRVTVSYTSPGVQPVTYSVVRSLLLVKVTASSLL